MKNAVVIDTNVFVSALLKAETAPRQILQLGFLGNIRPLMGNALFAEYRELMTRDKLFRRCPLSGQERLNFFDDFMSICTWVNIYYLWRPNLADESDNHVLELALAGNASHLITGNRKDFAKSELIFPQVKIVTPRIFLEERSSEWAP